MKYTIRAIKKSKGETPGETKEMPLNSLNKAILKCYFSDSTKNSVKYFLKWKASAKQICQNIGIDCDRLVLVEQMNGQELAYQIVTVYISIDESGLMVALGMKIDSEPSEKTRLFYLLTINYMVREDENSRKKKCIKRSQHLSYSTVKPDFLL